jgi:hypothetical protein
MFSATREDSFALMASATLEVGKMEDTIYTKTARFDTPHALTEDEMRKAAPSIFADTAHESRSERFAPIPTIEILRGLAKEQFFPVGVQQIASRLPGHEDHTKHLVRIRRLDDIERQVGDNVFEIMLRNANDGSAKYSLMGAMFRIRCLNSLVTHESTVDEVTVRHSGDALYNVIEGTYRVLASAERVLEAPVKWGAIPLDEPERIAFAAKAHALRFGEAEKMAPMAGSVSSMQLLEPRREGDKGHDLWSVFNVVQENAIRGGIEGLGTDRLGRERVYRTRPVKGIDQTVGLNRALWKLADETAAERTLATA